MRVQAEELEADETYISGVRIGVECRRLGKDTAMNTDPVIFAVIFIAVVGLICSAVIVFALNRVSGTSRDRLRRRKGYRAPAHRAFKDVM